MLLEIGRELKASELKIHSVVFVNKTTDFITMWVESVEDDYVIFRVAVLKDTFKAHRIGENREEFTDESGSRLHVYEYFGSADSNMWIRRAG